MTLFSLRCSRWRWASVLAFLVLWTAQLAAAAPTTDPNDPPDDPPLGCLDQVTGWIKSSAPSVVMHGSVVLTWSTNVPGGCSPTMQVTGFGPVARSDAKTVMPIGTVGNESATYKLTAYLSGKTKTLGSVTVGVRLPDPVNGRRTVEIRNNAETNWFIRALSTPNTTVLLHPDLHLNLTGRGTLHISPGVHILGGRTPSTPGARLFVTRSEVTETQTVLSIGEYLTADGVRIDGIRLDGGHAGAIEDKNDPIWIGIAVYSSVNVEIANSAIYGWSIAVQVAENSAEYETNRLAWNNSTAVWIHDNYIHDNRRWRALGYGVQTSAGAWALMERNHFDNNRHAVAGDGPGQTGYRAYHNFLGYSGGENCCLGTTYQYTHQFDEHGTEEDWWGRDAYAGRAGEYFDFRYNTLIYTNGDVIKIRGVPDHGADVIQNVFAKGEGSSAVSQTEGDNLRVEDNQFSIQVSSVGVVCDFDGDGVSDNFYATGASWWFRSDTDPVGQLHFLNTSSLKVPDLAFGDVDGDSICDVRVQADGRVFRGGRNTLLVNGKEVTARRTDLVWNQGTASVQVWQMTDPTLQTVPAQTTVTPHDDSGYPHAYAVMLGSGDFNADGAPDILWRAAYNNTWVLLTLLDDAGNAVHPSGWNAVPGAARLLGQMPVTTVLAGLGDFNGDGRSDILWRHENGQLEMWFAGEQGNAALVTWNNVTNEYGQPRVHEPVSWWWTVEAVADFNGDGYSDILWQAEDGATSIWYMEHAMVVGWPYFGPSDPVDGWTIEGVGDFDGDGSADTLWRAADGRLTLWFGGTPARQGHPRWKNYQWHLVPAEWQIQAVGDFNADGQADIVWRHTNGTVSIWTMSGATYIGESALLPMDTSWELRGLLAQAPQRINLQ